MSRLIEPESLPRSRAVVRFDLTGAPRGARPRLWLLLDRTGNEVCVESPGFPEDGVVTTDSSSLVRWSAGQLSVEAARETGGMTVAAPPWLERELSRWGRLNPFGGVASARSPAVASTS
jgi:hypothetical protein